MYKQLKWADNPQSRVKGRAFYSFTFFFAGSVAIYRVGATFKGVTVYSLMVVIVLICFVLITKAY